MTRNITFTADEVLIDAAREVARTENTTLNEQFRLWLEAYVRQRQADQALQTLRNICTQYQMTGAKPTRDEMNERH